MWRVSPWILSTSALLIGWALVAIHLFRKRDASVESDRRVSWFFFPLLAVPLLELRRCLGALENEFVKFEFWFYTLLLCGLAAVSMLGVLDDRWPLRGKTKLPVLLIAWFAPFAYVAWQVFSQDHGQIPVASVARVVLPPMILLSLAGAACLVSLPLIDGLDGLYAGEITLLIGYLISLEHFGINSPDHPSALQTWFDWHGLWIAAGLTVGVWIWNARGSVRLGEGAVYLLSFWVSVEFTLISLASLRERHDHISPSFTYPYSLTGLGFERSPVVWILLPLLYPILDFVAVLVSRMMRRRSPFSAGHDHLHHRLVQSGLRPLMASSAILSAANLPALLVVVWLFLHDHPGFIGVWLGGVVDAEAIAHQPVASHPSYPLLLCSLLPLAYLFWRGYTKVDPYKSGAVDERGRP